MNFEQPNSGYLHAYPSKMVTTRVMSPLTVFSGGSKRCPFQQFDCDRRGRYPNVMG